MNKNRLYIASAGSGKTTFLINEAHRIASTEKVLITTYTEANEAEIKRKFTKLHGVIAPNITVQTWFSFLLQHGVRPYQGSFHPKLFTNDIRGMLLVNSPSGIKYSFTNDKGLKINVEYKESEDFEKHYFTSNRKIYSDKLSKFVYKCNQKVENAVINRLMDIYPNIFIDEVQDLAGFDLEIIKLLMKSKSNVLLVGDPRQVTYLTHIPKKHKPFKEGKIKDFLIAKCKSLIKDGIDESTLGKSHRNNSAICDYSFRLYPDLPQPIPCDCSECHPENIDHQGIFIVRPEDVKTYYDQYFPTELRWSRPKNVHNESKAFNFGEAKGLGFGRVLIYPTDPMEAWIRNNEMELVNQARAKFYVGITRARYSVAFVMEYKDDKLPDGVNQYQGNEIK